MSRTVIEFAPTIDPWPILESWATKNRFELASAGEGGRSYKARESHVMMEPTSSGVRLTAWAVLAPTTDEFRVDRLGPIAIFPRLKTRGLVNSLLQELGQPRL